MSGDSKQDSDNTDACSKYMLHMLQQKTILNTNSSTIWDNTYGFDEQYSCATEFYLLSMFSHAHDIIIDHGVGSLGHGKVVFGGINATDKSYLSMLMTTVQLPNGATNNSQMVMHASTENVDISLAKQSQKHISDPSLAHILIDHGKDIKRSSERKWTEREYYVQDRKYVHQKSVKISCSST